MLGREEGEKGVNAKITSKLGETIRVWRQYNGLSVRELVIRAGLDEKISSYISKIENGYIKHPDNKRLQAIAGAFGITSDDLLRHQRPPTPNPLGAANESTEPSAQSHMGPGLDPHTSLVQRRSSLQEQQATLDAHQPILEFLNSWLDQVEDRLKASLGEMIQDQIKQILSKHPLFYSSNQTEEAQAQSKELQVLVNLARPPLIGIPCYAGERAGTLRPLYGINRVYVEAIERAGGAAVLIPHTKNFASVYPLCALLHGLLLPGGGDIDPINYQEEPHPALGRTDPEEDRLDLALVQYFLELDLPVLGISRGMQLINVARGGTLYQNIASQRPESLRHNYDYTPQQAAYRAHPIAIKPDTQLAGLLGTETCMVNSFHHQAVKEVGWDLTASAWAPDGIIEALEFPHHRFVIGVQFQAPELLLQGDQHTLRLFQGFIKAASHIKRVP